MGVLHICLIGCGVLVARLAGATPHTHLRLNMHLSRFDSGSRYERAFLCRTIAFYATADPPWQRRPDLGHICGLPAYRWRGGLGIERHAGQAPHAILINRQAQHRPDQPVSRNQAEPGSRRSRRPVTRRTGLSSDLRGGGRQSECLPAGPRR